MKNPVIARKYVEENYISKDRIREEMQWFEEHCKTEDISMNRKIGWEAIIDFCSDLLGE